ncbi:MAG: ATP synthase F0 subunit B [Polyangiaceae bacterium]|nr:ATP synthase F0 subunit B [Polyangiaceae bacterium]
MSNVGKRIGQSARTLALRVLPVGALGLAAALSLGGVAFASTQTEANPAGHGEGAESEDHRAPTVDDINWAYGLVGEREDVEPGLLFRPVGMPPPLLASVLNSVVLLGILIYFGRKPIGEALRKRKEEIMRGMQEAARMKEEATRQFADYEAQLAGMEERIEKARHEMRRAGELERERVVSEAGQRRERMEHEARRLVDQELETARAELMRRVVRAAAVRAERMLAAEVSAQDQRRLADAYLNDVNAMAGVRGVQP